MSVKKGWIVIAPFFCLFYLVPAGFADAQDFTKPEFNGLGDVVIIRRSGEAQFRLQSLNPSTGELLSRNLEVGRGAGLPKLRKDALGRLWAAWTEEDDGRTDIVLGRVEKTLQNQLRIHVPIQSRLPWDYCLDAEGTMWLTWVEQDSLGQAICIEEPASGRKWTISSKTEEAQSPRLLCDAWGNPWAFWTAVTPVGEQVFCSTFDGTRWSNELLLTPASGFPHITPRAAAGRDGNLWLVWSGFDGLDYEILARKWDGSGWSPVMAVTDNSGANDVFPSVDLAFGTQPIVSWVRYTKQGRLEMIRCGQFKGWGQERVLTGPIGDSNFTPLAVADEVAVTARPEGDELSWNGFYLPYPSGRERREDLSVWHTSVAHQKGPASLPGLIYNPSLRENTYVAFGDSITYGVCDEDRIDDPGDYIPEKSYPPRLEVLLTQSFGAHTVANEGIPGESTFQGLARFDAVLAKHEGRYILILEGTNDIIWNDYSLDTTAFNLREMLRRSLEFGALPALATNIPRFGLNANRIRLNNLNARIRTLAGERPVPLVDLYQDFSDYPVEDGGTESLYCWGEDRTHPNEEGYQFMAEKWFERIRVFPFPASDARIQRDQDQILFYQAEGNLLEWADNPKILDPGRIQEYRIYRKKSAEATSAFRIVKTVVGQRSFFDSDILAGETYSYVLATVVLDGLEGPCTQPLIQ